MMIIRNIVPIIFDKESQIISILKCQEKKKKQKESNRLGYLSDAKQAIGLVLGRSYIQERIKTKTLCIKINISRIK